MNTTMPASPAMILCASSTNGEAPGRASQRKTAVLDLPHKRKRAAPVFMTGLAAPIHWQRWFSEILVRGDFGCGSSFGFFTA
jgi:hypothetical protein